MNGQAPSVSAPPGRDAEVSALAAALDTLESGRGGVVIVSGEGGVGKTTLSAWAAEEARTRGMTVLDAPCFELSIDTPYACLVSALGPVLRGERGVDRSLAAGLHSLRLLFDGLDTGDGSLPQTDDRLARSRLHGAIATLCSRLSGITPVVLVVDDLHWADSVSLEVLHSLATDLPDTPLVLLATLRPFETAERVETRRLVRAFRSAEWTTAVDVVGLDLEATRLLVQRRLGSIFPTRVVELVHERSGGTPLVAEELLEVMIETGSLRAVGRSWVLDVGEAVPVPAVADDLIGDRLERLGEEAVELVAAIAIAGRAVAADLLAAVVVRPREVVVAELEALRRAGLVDRTEVGPRTEWVVHHPIMGEVAVSLLGAERRSRVHRGYVAHLPHDAVERRAHHVVGAGEHDIPVDQLRDLVEAGRVALGRGAPDEACRLLGFALDAIDDHGAPDDRLVDVLWTLGDAWSRRGEFAVACHHLDRARGLARAAGALSDEVGILTSFENASWNGSNTDLDFAAETATLLERLEVDGQWGEAHRLLRSRLMSEFRAGGAPPMPDALDTLDRFDRRLAESQREDGTDDEEMAEALAWSRHFRVIDQLVAMRDGPDLLERIDEELPTVAVGSELHRRMLHERLDLTLLLGSRDEIARAIADERAVAEAHGDAFSWRVGLAAWDVAMGDGDLDRTAEIEEVMRVVQVDRPVGYLVVARALTDLLTGRMPSPVPELAGGRPAGDPVLEELLVFAELWRSGDRDDAAHAAIEFWARRPLMSGMPLVGPVGAGLAHLHLGDLAGLEGVVRALEDFDRGDGRTSAWAQVLRGEAATGRERGMAYLDAAARFDRLGRPFDAAICALTAAEAGVDVDGGRLTAAGRLFRDAPAPWLSERLSAVGGSAGDEVPSATRRLDELGLTRREREVAEVVAEGLSNREAANRLFISVRTVTSHLDHIYTKLGIGSRAELAALVAGIEPADT